MKNLEPNPDRRVYQIGLTHAEAEALRDKLAFWRWTCAGLILVVLILIGLFVLCHAAPTI